ncbi:MAG: alkaline phosphatase D [Pirellulaceae bacterium]|jgi:alkaline phosphatase D
MVRLTQSFGVETVLMVLLCALAHAAAESADVEPLARIMFGSCVKQEQPMPIFETIAAARPDLFVFLGDNIYADTTDMDVMRAKYAKLKANRGFGKLLDACTIHATWDDHDFGVNDGGADYSKRKESQQIFVDFWGDAEDSPRRSRPGIYESQIYGPAGKRVQIIVLDTRYFRGPLKTGERRVGGPYYPTDDNETTMLGEAQWKWFEQQLKQPAELRIIASSIQCLAESSGQETWSNIPRERERFFRLITKTKADGVFIISGDRHWSELSRVTQKAPYPIYDLTSSSFNQIHQRGTPTINKHRISPTTFHRENFGAILVDWDSADPQLTVQIRNIEGAPQIEKKIMLSELRAKTRSTR